MVILSIIFGFFFGASLGSFASASAWAWLNDQKIPYKRSVCGHCKRALAPWQLIPVFSYLGLRGRCARCGQKIPTFHFWIELLSGLAGGACFWLSGLSWQALIHTAIATALVTASATDIRARLVPDFVSLGCLAFAPVLVALQNNLTLFSAITGWLTGGGVALGLRLAFQFLRSKEALGLGDVKLFALGGAFCGFRAVPCIFFFSSFCGLCGFVLLALFERKQHENADCGKLWDRQLAFGPFICLSILAITLFPQLPGMFYRLL